MSGPDLDIVATVVPGASVNVLSVLVGVAIGVLVMALYIAIKMPVWTRAERGDAVERSRTVLTGKIHEQLAPHLPGFAFNPADARFLGSPVDFVVFDGLDEGTLRRVVFVEVKTGASKLSPRERQLRDVVRARGVEWVELRPDLAAAAQLPSPRYDRFGRPATK